MEEKKMMSRKFIVWIVATVLFIAAIVLAFVIGKSDMIETFIPYWGMISMLYIGGNVAQDFAFNLGRKKDKE